MTAPATSPDSPATEAKAPPFGEGIALLWGYVRPRLATICLGIFLGLLGTGVGLASPLTTKWVLDTLGTPGALARPVTILIALLAVSSIAYLAQAVVLGRLAENIVLDARTSLIQRFFRAHLEDIQAFKTGELVTRVTSDTVLLREAAATSVVQIVNGTVSLIGTVVLMAVLDLPLLGTTLAALAIITVLFIILMPKIGKADKQAQDAIGEVGAALKRSRSISRIPIREGRQMFSSALSVGMRLKDWKMKPMESRRSRVSWRWLMSLTTFPSISTRPESADSSPTTQCIRVDLPEPEGPMTAVNWPRGMSRSTPRSACTRASPRP